MLKLAVLCLMAISVAIGEIHQNHVHSTNDFAIDVFSELIKQNRSNIVFSGFSVQTLLQLTYLGAKGETAEQLKKVLQLPESHEELQNYVRSFHSEVDELEGPTLVLANRMFLAENLKVEPEFTKVANEIFRVGVENIDFSDGAKAAEEINSWVAKETHDKIKNLIQQDQLSILTRIVLANSLYFKGEFQHPFDPQNTKEMDFHKENNETVKVPMMELTHSLKVYESQEHKITIIQLPYASSKGRVKLLLGLPHEHMHHYLSTSKKMAPELHRKYSNQNVKLFLPKFRIETSIDLKPVLKNLGITNIFSAPDLSGISPEAVEISAINQKVFIDVNEHGTEAAAATAALANAYSFPIQEEVQEYHFNRPFLFCLRLDDIVLLGGRVTNPLDK